MSDSLRKYEGDVELARTKLNASLDRLRSPDTLSAFSDDLKNEARDIKDDLVEQTKSAAKTQLNSMVEDLKARAASNPAAALAIGAGLGWHFLRNPPIASALIGLGAFSLWRTHVAPQPSSAAKPDYLEMGKQRLKEQAVDAAGRAKDAALEGQDRLSEKIGELKTKATDTVRNWTSEVQDTVGDLAASLRVATPSIVPTVPDVDVQGMAKTASDTISHAVSQTRDYLTEQDSRDKLLLGLAGAAVVAAFGIAVQKRFSES